MSAGLTPGIRRAVAVHGMTRRGLGTWVTVWAVIGFSNAVALPRIDPDISAQVRPMETIFMVLLCLPAGLLGLVAQASLVWLTLPPRLHVRGAEAGWTILLLAAQAAASVGVASILPISSRTRVTVVCTALLLACVAISVACFLNTRIAVLAPAAVMMPFSFQGLVPWDMNLFFNPELRATLILAAALAALGTVVMSFTTVQKQPGAAAA